MDAVFADVRALAVALFGDGEDVSALAGGAGADDEVPAAQTDAAHADGRTAGGAHVGLVEADGHAAVGGDEDLLVARGLQDGDQLVALLKRQRADAACADVFQRGLLHALDRAVARDEDEVAAHVDAAAADHRADLFIGLDLQDVDDVRAAGVAPGLRDLVALLDIDPSAVGEEQDVVVGRGGKDRLGIVLVLGGHGSDAAAAAALGAVFADGQALDIAAVGQRVDALLLLDEILDIDLVLDVLDLGAALVAVLVADRDQLLLEHLADHLRRGEQLFIIRDLLLELLILLLELFAVEPLQLDQAHVADGLRLHLGEGEALHQVLLGVVIARTDDADDLVDIVLGDQQALEQVGALLRLSEIVARAADNDVLLEAQVFVEDVAQREDLGLGLVVDQGQHIDRKARLHGRLGEEAVEHDLGIGVAL